jgi:hypothetical protein
MWRAPPGVGPAIESNGFRFFPAGLDESLEDMQERQARHTNSNPAEHGNYMQAYVFAGVRAERSLPDLLNIISDWHPDILVRENTEYGGYVAAERAGIPHATVQITAFRPHLMDVVTEPLNRLHASVYPPTTTGSSCTATYCLRRAHRSCGTWPPLCHPPCTPFAMRPSTSPAKSDYRTG